MQKRFIYSPPPPNYPFFSKKGETKAAVYVSGGDARGPGGSENHYNRGYDLQGAYAISNNWAVTFGYNKRTERDTYKSIPHDFIYDFFDTSTINYNRSMTELGAGYFASARPNDIRFSIYGGVGFGKYTINETGRNRDTGYARFLNCNVMKFYLQPGISVNATRDFFVAFVTRFSLLKYSSISTSYTADELEYFKLQTIYNSPVLFTEPSLILQYEIPPARWLKVEASYTLNINLTSDVYYRKNNASLGLVFDFSKFNSSIHK